MTGYHMLGMYFFSEFSGELHSSDIHQSQNYYDVKLTSHIVQVDVYNFFLNIPLTSLI